MHSIFKSSLYGIARVAVLAVLASPMWAGDHMTLGNSAKKYWTLRLEEGSTGTLVMTDLKTKNAQTLNNEWGIGYAREGAKYDLDFQSPEGGSYEIIFSLVDEGQVDNRVTWVASGGKVALRSNPLGIKKAPMAIFGGKFLILNRDTWAHASMTEEELAESKAADAKTESKEVKTETKEASKS